jgi:hypothetical protein
MTPHDPLKPLRRRAHRHALEDGIADLAVGLYTITVGVATQNRALLAIAVAYLFTYLFGWRWFHARLSSRRTGYAEAGEQLPRVLLTGSLAAATVTLLVVAAITLASGVLWDLAVWPAWTPVLAGLVLTAGFLYSAAGSGLRRYYAYATLSAAGSLFFWLFPFGPAINPSDRLTLFLLVVGAAMLLGGVGAMLRFRRAHPVVTLEAHDAR